MPWPKSLNKKIRAKVNLAPLTSFKVGGPAEFFLEPSNIRELREALVFAKRAGMPVFILGAGSNILVSDSGLRGLVIKLGGEFFKQVRSRGSCIEAGAGLYLSRLMLYAKNKGLSGLEFLAGLPGTLGGALAGNAGAWGSSIGDRVEEVRVLDYSGKIKLLGLRQIKFSYRKSNLNKYIILSARFKLRRADKQAIDSRMRGFILRRRKAQTNRLPSAGCIFKNPGKQAAGMLID
ncbi:MAG: UDP-N-acetylmuramate dehydrogenase, partial [Candidatus Omnitrophica bacterium]|nr:UDP-N-acetylmuramate dehydrogenase [Candidatus Omnitrophota bacterium]